MEVLQSDVFDVFIVGLLKQFQDGLLVLFQVLLLAHPDQIDLSHGIVVLLEVVLASDPTAAIAVEDLFQEGRVTAQH